MRLKTKKKTLCGMTAFALVTVVTLMGCSVQQSDGSLGDGLTEVDKSASAAPLLPVVATDDEGNAFQRTPTDTYGDGNASNADLGYAGDAYEFNTRFLDADNRGCSACHDDLAQTVEDMGINHPYLLNGYGIQPTVQMCEDCHVYAHGYVVEDYNFGQLMHQIHSDERSVGCWSCHTGTEDGNGMQLWDEVKYDWLRGIKDVKNVEGDFSFTQDSVRHRADGDNLVDFLETKWAGFIDFGEEPGNHEQSGLEQNELPLDQELFDSWTITITGAVDQEMTWTLPELIAQAPSEDVALKMSCEWNPTGGPMISNSAVRGIPLSWLFEQAGISEDAYGIAAIPAAFSSSGTHPDETTNRSYLDWGGYGTLLAGNEDDEAYLVYQLDGTDLQWSEGYPVGLWVAGYGSAATSTKQVSDIVVYEEEEFYDLSAEQLFGFHGWVSEKGMESLFSLADEGLAPDEIWKVESQGWFVNKPNVGVFNNREGRIINAGESYTFEGYADSFDNEVTAVEFSMDGGQTWTSYVTEGATDDRWVNWKFTYTPEEEGAYVLMIRSKNVNGLVTPEPIELMFNVKSA